MREGVVRGLDGDTLTLETAREPRLSIPLSPTARLQIRQTKTGAGRGAGLGALFGGAGLAIVGLTSCDGEGLFDPSPGACALAGGALGAGAGALVGLFIGATSKSYRWVEVDRGHPPAAP